MITASDFRSRLSNTLRGFFTLTLAPSGIVLRECSLHEKDGKRWISFPSKPQLDTEGRHRTDPNTRKKLYASIVEIPDRAAREQFQGAAIQAVDKLLGKGSAP
jgi:hypothetical protein